MAGSCADRKVYVDAKGRKYAIRYHTSGQKKGQSYKMTCTDKAKAKKASSSSSKKAPKKAPKKASSSSSSKKAKKTPKKASSSASKKAPKKAAAKSKSSEKKIYEAPDGKRFVIVNKSKGELMTVEAYKAKMTAAKVVCKDSGVAGVKECRRVPPKKVVTETATKVKVSPVKKVAKAAPGCVEMTTKRYTSADRKAPAYAAASCKDTVKLGRDGAQYKSMKDKNGVYRWYVAKKPDMGPAVLDFEAEWAKIRKQADVSAAAAVASAKATLAAQRAAGKGK